MKLHISMNLHGLVAVDSAIMHEEEEYEVPVTITPPAAAAAAAVPEANGPAANGPAPMEAESAAAGGKQWPRVMLFRQACSYLGGG